MGTSWGAILFGGCVIIVTLGVLWFHIGRPILESLGWMGDGSSAAGPVEPVKVYRPVVAFPEPITAQTRADGTDQKTDRLSVSAHDQLWQEFLLDKTRANLIAVMLDSDVLVGEFRPLLKGDNNVIAAEVDAARKRLGIVAPDRQLRVKDEKGERVIPLAPSR